MINKHSWLHRLDSDRHRLRSFSGSQTVGHTVTAFWGCTTKASFVEWTKNIMSLLMLSCWPSFTKVKPCSFKTCRANGNKPFFFIAGICHKRFAEPPVSTHGNTHHSCLSVLWSHDLRKLNSCHYFFIFLAMHPKRGTNASNRNRSCVVLISLDDILSSSPANLCWVISWQDKVMCYNLTVCIGRTMPWNGVMWTIRLCYWAVF